MKEIILSVVVAACTIVYTFINGLMLIENKRLRKIKSMPLIIAYLKSTEDHKVLRLCIKNVGEGVAKDVKVKIDGDYKAFGLEYRMLSNLGIMKYGLNIFPPQEQLAYLIDSWIEIGKRKDIENSHIDMSIDYAGIDGKKYSNTYHLLPVQLSGQDYTSPPETYIGKIAYFMEQISKVITGSKYKT
jgi:hypothetical protein